MVLYMRTPDLSWARPASLCKTLHFFRMDISTVYCFLLGKVLQYPDHVRPVHIFRPLWAITTWESRGVCCFLCPQPPLAKVQMIPFPVNLAVQ